MDEQENLLSIKDSVLIGPKTDNNDASASRHEIIEEVWPSEAMTKENNENETIPAFNEYDLLNSTCDSRYSNSSMSLFFQFSFVFSSELVLPSNSLR